MAPQPLLVAWSHSPHWPIELQPWVTPVGRKQGPLQDSESLINKININGKRQSASGPNTNQSDVINRAKGIMWQEKRGLGHRCTTKWEIREMKVDRVCPVQSGDWMLNLSDVSSQVMGELLCLGETVSSNTASCGSESMFIKQCLDERFHLLVSWYLEEEYSSGKHENSGHWIGIPYSENEYLGVWLISQSKLGHIKCSLIASPVGTIYHGQLPSYLFSILPC